MSTNELKEFFTRQGKMYHSKVNAICCLEAALQEQVKIKCDGQIPHKHIPQLLHTNETGENQKFLTQYKHLFLSYLDQVLHNNQKHLSELTVELEQILMSTDKEAATFKTPNRPLSFHYNKFFVRMILRIMFLSQSYSSDWVHVGLLPGYQKEIGEEKGLTTHNQLQLNYPEWQKTA